MRPGIRLATGFAPMFVPSSDWVQEVQEVHAAQTALVLTIALPWRRNFICQTSIQ